MEKKGRQGKLCKQLRDYLEERRRYWKLKEEAVDRAVLRTRFGRGNGPVVKTLREDERVCYRTTASSIFPVTDLATSCIELV